MTLDQIANFIKGIVSGTHDAVVTTVNVADADDYPDPASGEYNLTWYDATNYPDPSDDPNKEIVRVTARDTGIDTLTVTRNQEGSGASTKSTGGATYKLILAPTKKTMEDLDDLSDRPIVLEDDTPTEDGAIAFDRSNEDLIVGDGSASQKVGMGAWKSWTPTPTNFTVGNGVLTAKYQQVGKTVICRFEFTLGSTSSMGTIPTFTIPVTAAAHLKNMRTGGVYIEDLATAAFIGNILFNGTAVDTVTLTVMNVASTYAGNSSITATVPMTWATGDIVTGIFTYEAA